MATATGFNCQRMVSEKVIGMQIISENKKKFTFGKKFKSVKKNKMLRNMKAEI